MAIAPAFGLRPDVLPMDEPFSALDEFTREAMRLQMLALRQRMRTTTVFVTQWRRRSGCPPARRRCRSVRRHTRPRIEAVH